MTGERVPELIKLNFRVLTDVQVIAKKLNRSTMDKILKEVNTQSRDWLMERTVKNLNESITKHGRPQKFNRIGTRDTPAVKSLRATIATKSSHIVTAQSLDFMVDSKVREKSPHYYVIEEGYSFIGNEAPIGFRAGNKKVRSNASRYPHDATLRGAGKVTITKAIKGYHYVSRTVNQFLDEEVFEDYLEAAVTRLRQEIPGLVININRGPNAKKRIFS